MLLHIIQRKYIPVYWLAILVSYSQSSANNDRQIESESNNSALGDTSARYVLLFGQTSSLIDIIKSFHAIVTAQYLSICRRKWKDISSFSGRK
jgi:hypothetical protein